MTSYDSTKKKAKKDYDGDGKVESSSKEHAGAVHNAIQRKKVENLMGKILEKNLLVKKLSMKKIVDPVVIK